MKGRPSKRRADVSDSGSSKRQRLPTESSETFKINPADSTVSLKLFKLPGLLLLPEVIEKARNDWKTMSAAYESEKEKTFEAALKRATRRANVAEHKKDAIQQHANNLEAEKEAQAKALEAKDKLLEAKDKALEAKDKALEAKDKALEAMGKALEANDKATKTERNRGA